MKRIVVFLAMALMAFSVAQAESEQDSTFVFGPADTETAAPELTPSPTPASTPIPTDSGDSGFDFSQVDNPLATPVAVNPIDMPTPTPTPTATPVLVWDGTADTSCSSIPSTAKRCSTHSASRKTIKT